MSTSQLRTGSQNISKIKPASRITWNCGFSEDLSLFIRVANIFFAKPLWQVETRGWVVGGWVGRQLIFNFATSADHRHQLPLLLLIISLWTFVFILWRPTLMHSGAFFVFLESRNKFWIMAGHLYHAFVSVKISNRFALWEFVIVGCRVAVFCIIGTTCTIVTQCQTAIMMVMMMMMIVLWYDMIPFKVWSWNIKGTYSNS